MSLTAMKILVLENIPNIWELANTPKINENVSGIVSELWNLEPSNCAIVGGFCMFDSIGY